MNKSSDSPLDRYITKNWTMVIVGNRNVNICETDNVGNNDGSNDYNLLFEFIAYGLVLNVVGVFGILGNIITMIILSRPQMKTSINYLLIGLARCDTVLIFTSIMLFGLPVIYKATNQLFVYYYKVHPLITPVVFPIAMISQTVSVYLTLTVTLERFQAVCYPLQARSLCTYGRARACVGLIILFSVLYNITRFMEAEYHECFHPNYTQILYQLHPTPLRDNETYISIYINWMYLVVMYIIPFSLLVVLNAAIYNQVRLANRERQRLSQLRKKEIGLATMLLCVVVVFLFCNFWALVANVTESFYGKRIEWLIQFSNLLVTINSSINFVIYVIFGEKFKRLFFKLFFPQGVCGWHPAGDGRRGGTGGHAGAADESEATGNGAAMLDCQNWSGRSNRVSRRTQHQHQHQYSVNDHRGTGNTASSALSLYGGEGGAACVSNGNSDSGPSRTGIRRDYSIGTTVEESQM
ncbi:7TM GPCR, serpentine receptor class w (Srw),GPCR, rhodopsin-like, 7TM,G protein-coupled [Cinara cedri]|uniref:7TM GPCR, serpentine receptor class w (Srw),GPCR, rhodopsin-like, 7TM,G protein-coupled n=1 Tax=Cinara cedri TaxID=506608 RepID=A0A5E4NCS5_9HEMI|nr:7TM GPCR, serpentine receptor class w (Srw),GPCR, rhodopsin-like, 7TM,G protein-coupled [Cinara cedri]